MFRTEFEEAERRSVVTEAQNVPELRSVLANIGVSPADVLLADKVLLVEGPNDIPVFKAFLENPSFRGQNVAVLSLGGATVASGNFDADHWV